jgi:hypothetical protein
LEEPYELVDNNKFLKVLKDEELLEKFKSLPKERQTEIIDQILSAESENKQIQLIGRCIIFLEKV